jgi:hypothetical protein
MLLSGANMEASNHMKLFVAVPVYRELPAREFVRLG